ncbi:hypothetical protein GE21DRAFT_5553 [Neurospora crassa]|uniref:Uncharacterized protein n=1 Tax=Neurospora crassa (strain ATCC 24698 / 74-OR23-1A / CBS 708.71 / DSM 1257 / FGSC 987) TaxID=367110 RepID=A7UWT3_NEUCR|nr:hypothetical protein NCU11323 [Neurospora crassa OR74A]EDO65104.2 hypothetical protein NCU11323 [Neurospora crassa OR74A]KHE80506.1 hypothetical protein GE21DRAFT_5553 [Neurospora crassa]|eukprot:XP_001728195.2 hypothetical protein NCU11323 [Neurospora crassa OR74A]
MSSTKTAPAPSSIITSAPYSDLTETLTKSPTSSSSSSTSPATTRSKSHSQSSASSSSSDAYAQRAMDHTSTWQPKLDRRQSWSQEQYKHEMQLRSGSTGGSVRKVVGEEGFTEGGHGY